MVPFVAKVLESCADSRVFKPPNPWTMAIMSVLSELHAVPDLKVCCHRRCSEACLQEPLVSYMDRLHYSIAETYANYYVLIFILSLT